MCGCRDCAMGQAIVVGYDSAVHWAAMRLAEAKVRDARLDYQTTPGRLADSRRGARRWAGPRVLEDDQLDQELVSQALARLGPTALGEQSGYRRSLCYAWSAAVPCLHRW